MGWHQWIGHPTGLIVAQRRRAVLVVLDRRGNELDTVIVGYARPELTRGLSASRQLRQNPRHSDHSAERTGFERVVPDELAAIMLTIGFGDATAGGFGVTGLPTTLPRHRRLSKVSGGCFG